MYVYAITDGVMIKVGISKHPDKRVRQLNTGSSNRLYLLGYYIGDRQEENYIHRKFYTVKGEWLNPTQELIDYLNEKLRNDYIDWIKDRLVSYKKIQK